MGIKGSSVPRHVLHVIQLTMLHLPTFAELYIKQSLHVANTETFKPQKRDVPPGSTRKKFHSRLLII